MPWPGSVRRTSRSSGRETTGVKRALRMFLIKAFANIGNHPLKMFKAQSQKGRCYFSAMKTSSAVHLTTSLTFGGWFARKRKYSGQRHPAAGRPWFSPRSCIHPFSSAMFFQPAVFWIGILPSSRRQSLLQAPMACNRVFTTGSTSG